MKALTWRDWRWTWLWFLLRWSLTAVLIIPGIVLYLPALLIVAAFDALGDWAGSVHVRCGFHAAFGHEASQRAKARRHRISLAAQFIKALSTQIHTSVDSAPCSGMYVLFACAKLSRATACASSNGRPVRRCQDRANFSTIPT